MSGYLETILIKRLNSLKKRIFQQSENRMREAYKKLYKVYLKTLLRWVISFKQNMNVFIDQSKCN